MLGLSSASFTFGKTDMACGSTADVRFGSKTDMTACLSDVRFYPRKRTLNFSLVMGIHTSGKT